METKKYDANFTAGGLLINEFIALQPFLLGEDFVSKMKEEIENNNLIGIATKSARQRVVAEIIRRFNSAPTGFWKHFFNWNLQEMKFGLLFLCFKTYPLILDVHLEVALKKFKTGNTLEAYDIQMRLDEIASNDKFVAEWSSITFKRLNSHYRTAIKTVGIYDGKNLIRPLFISPLFWQYFKDINEGWFVNLCFTDT